VVFHCAPERLSALQGQSVRSGPVKSSKGIGGHRCRTTRCFLKGEVRLLVEGDFKTRIRAGASFPRLPFRANRAGSIRHATSVNAARYRG